MLESFKWFRFKTNTAVTTTTQQKPTASEAAGGIEE
jgi:hypothetical protein